MLRRAPAQARVVALRLKLGQQVELDRLEVLDRSEQAQVGVDPGGAFIAAEDDLDALLAAADHRARIARGRRQAREPQHPISVRLKASAGASITMKRWINCASSSMRPPRPCASTWRAGPTPSRWPAAATADPSTQRCAPCARRPTACATAAWTSRRGSRNWPSGCRPPRGSRRRVAFDLV